MKTRQIAIASSENRPLSLRANFSWTFLGNVIYAAAQWGMLVVLARLGSPEMVGMFALGLAVTAPVLMLANLQLRAVQATDARRDYTFADYFGLRIITTALALLVIVAIATATYRGEAVAVIVLISAAKAFESLSDAVYGFLQQRERMDRIAQSMMIKGPTSLAALAAGVLLTDSVTGGVVGMLVVWVLLFFLYDLESARRLVTAVADLRPRWDRPRLLRLAWLALPLGFVMMLTSLVTSIPRLFVERYLGEAQLGIFAALTYLLVAGNTVVGALGQSASPRLAKYYADGNRPAFAWLLWRLVGIGAALGTLGIGVALLAGEFILNLLYGPEYATEAGVFVWIMVAGMILYLTSFAGYSLTAARHIQLQPVVLSVCVLASIVAGTTLIPTHGLLGAAWTVIITSATQLILMYVYLVWAVRTSQSQKAQG